MNLYLDIQNVLVYCYLQYLIILNVKAKIDETGSSDKNKK